MKKIAIAMLGLIVAGAAGAKLPPLSDEAKAKAGEAKQKAAWGEKVSAYKLCLSQDKVAAHYRKTKGSEAKPATATVPCQDPGTFVPTVASAATPTATPAPAPVAAAPATAPKK
jgi:hypothetical protein